MRLKTADAATLVPKAEPAYFPALAVRDLPSPSGAELALGVAQTPEEREHGLVGRPPLQPQHGMLFVFDSDAMRAMWMRGMNTPLDFVFVAHDGTVIVRIRCTRDRVWLSGILRDPPISRELRVAGHP